MRKHLAAVEDWWCSQWLADNPPVRPWQTVDWDADPDWEWRTAADDTPEELAALWTDAVDRSRTCMAEALTTGGLDQLARRSGEDGQSPSLRWILVHLIEEYARHNGHADLIRESVDGSTGE